MWGWVGWRCCRFHIKWPLFSAKTFKIHLLLVKKWQKKRPNNKKYAVAVVAAHSWRRRNDLASSFTTSRHTTATAT